MKKITWGLILVLLVLSPATVGASKLTWSQTDTLVFPAGKRLTATYAHIDSLAGTVTFFAGSRLTVSYIDPDTIAGTTVRATAGSTWTFPAGSRITASYADIDTLSGNVVIPAGATVTIDAGSKIDASRVDADTLGDSTRATAGSTWTFPAGSRIIVAYVDPDTINGSVFIQGGNWTAAAGTQQNFKHLRGDSVATDTLTVLGPMKVTGYAAGAAGALVETNLASAAHAEAILLQLSVYNAGGLEQVSLADASGAYSGTSTFLTGGFHTTANLLTILQAATSAGDQDSNKVFLDSDDNYIHIKKTGGSAIVSATNLIGYFGYTSADVSTIQAINIFTVVSDNQFTGNPSAIKLSLVNSSGAYVDPWSLVIAGQNYKVIITGYIKY